MAVAASEPVNFSRPANNNADGEGGAAVDVGQHGATALEKSNGRPRGASMTGRNVRSDNGAAVPPERNNGTQLPRAASYTYLPNDGEQAIFEIKGVTKGDYIAKSDNETASISPSEETSGWNTPEDDTVRKPPPQAHDVAAHLQRTSGESRLRQTESARSSRSTLQSFARDSGTSIDSDQTISTVATTPSSSQRPSLNKSFSKRFSGRSWYPSSSSTPASRSPSPTKVDSIVEQPIAEVSLEAKSDPTLQSSSTGRRKSFQFRKKSSKPAKELKAKDQKLELLSSGDEKDKPSGAVARKGTLLRKKATRAAGLAKVGSHDETQKQSLPESIQAVPPLPKSFPTDRLPSLAHPQSNSDRPAPVPRIPSSEKHHISPLSVTKKKDELWTQFRSLDADFSKFQAKSSALKANVVRTTLIPFLRTYSAHTSNKSLRPEDLDRRTSIFNKWWTGLIEMLAGKNNQSISGTDRPIVLDGISGIMERPEWRTPPSPFCPLNERVKVSLGVGGRSNTSLTSSSSDFLSDSVHHNVRNTFITNLTSQMAFVVDKMSLRNASASLVTFCGKACAYAFMFVPGMADVLVRLWDLPFDNVRRVLQENGISKFDSIPELVCAEIVSNFPPALHQLGFVSLPKYSRKMRTPPALPVGTAHIQWWGHWTERWSGRESDLFYVFVKHFHILAVDFLPPQTTKHQRMCAPGLLPIHAQILANVELTIHREAHHAQHDLNAAPTPTFDDVLGDPDIHASSLPVPPTNAVRLMAENRLVMLIRDFLSERTADHPLARELFAQSFHDLLQAAARGTSMFNHSACYTLLDFLEEVLVILVRYDNLRSSDDPLVDSSFWQTVFRKMIDSENTMTEIRLYAFLFTIWNSIVGLPERKKDTCLRLLLDPDLFESRFNHWCPMVRAYYMRLLCWRVGRYDDEEDPDLSLLEALQERLQHTWSHYLYLRNKADHENSLRPESYPCHPAPGRRLLIVRTDNIVSPGNSFLTFDGLMKDANIPMAKATAAAVGLAENIDLRPDSSSSNKDSDQETSGKGLFGALKKMIGGGPKKPSSKDTSAAHALRETPDTSSHSGPIADSASAPEKTSKTIAEKPKHRSLSFRFSLEFHPSNRPHAQMKLLPPRLPAPAHGLLQEKSNIVSESTAAAQPCGASVARARYAGRALAEWTVVVGECGSFFDRRLKEGVPGRQWVETPTLGVELFKRPS
ncbi:hypothetical protein Slin15195_G089150 [Septoria linicola]|uniref:DUF1765-domain-containing protein n=1 Tax=Septoria linicola TaxID=215465 RepID=A0A9Q9B1L4_9PEZI|nr:hypothetical protein Slin15195_G089150 [Septoria linicola]